MDARTKIMYERGLYFIETGTPLSVKRWLEEQALALIPRELVVKLEYFVSVGDKDSASNLWLKMCKLKDIAKARMWWDAASLVAHAAIAGLTIYCFIYIMIHP